MRMLEKEHLLLPPSPHGEKEKEILLERHYDPSLAQIGCLSNIAGSNVRFPHVISRKGANSFQPWDRVCPDHVTGSVSAGNGLNPSSPPAESRGQNSLGR